MCVILNQVTVWLFALAKSYTDSIAYQFNCLIQQHSLFNHMKVKFLRCASVVACCRAATNVQFDGSGRARNRRDVAIP